jgi:predicted Fe-Mo cluster-binding NifX family protein
MRVAVSVWGERVSPVLDTASTIRIAEIGGENLREGCFDVRLDDMEFCRRCSRICGLGIDVIICGAVSKAMSIMLEAAGIKVISGISGNCDRVVDAYFDGTLSSPRFRMPGY